MRLTFVLPFFSRRPIGGLRVVYELANGLAARGHRVTVVHPSSLPGLAKPRDLRSAASRLLDRAIALRGVPWMAIDARVAMAHVERISPRSVPDADVVVATNWQTAQPVGELPQSKGRRLYLVQDFHPYIAPREALERSWRSGFRLAAVSQWLADMVRAAGVRSQDVTRISCGISSAHRMLVAPEERAPSIAMMYGLAGNKAAGDGVKALEIARSEVGAFPVRMFGPNSSRRPAALPAWAEYRPLLSDAGVSGLYNGASVFVSSSLAEGFCLPAGEAMASGCAVVATDCGGIRDFAVDGSNALLSTPGDPAGLARNIVRALNEPALRHRLARQGMETIRAFTWEAAAERFEAFASDTGHGPAR